MKIKVYSIILFLSVLLINSCDSDVVNPRSEKGVVLITSTPDAAAIWIDGVDTKKLTPAKVEVAVGKHIITLRKKQYVSESITIDVKANEEKIINVEKLIMQGGVRIFSKPSFANIFINGFDEEVTTPDEFNLLEGRYEITLKLEDFFDSTYVVNIKNSLDVTDTIKLRSKSIVSFNGIIWDISSTDPNRPAGLDLSTGKNVQFKDRKSKSADLYYFAKKNILGSPSSLYFENRNTMMREGGVLYNDRINAPEELDDTWSDTTKVNTSKYFFVYDGSGHNSKVQVVGSVSHGNLKGIRVKWLYNKKAYDNFF